MSFEGSIGEIDLVQRLVELGRENFTGAIRFEEDGIIKIVYFKAGDVLSASTNDRKDAIDEILLRAGKVGKEHVKQALAKRQDTETLGDALLNLGFITRKELTWARRVQVIGILRSVRAWTNGAYAIVADYLPKREEGTLFPLQQIIVEFIVTEQDRPTFDRAMDGGEAVFHKSATFDESFRKLDLNEDAGEIVREIDGSKSAADIAGATGKDAFNVYKLLEALRVLGIIEKGGSAVVAPEVEQPLAVEMPVNDDLAFETAGVSDAADAWSAPPEPAMTFEEQEPKIPFALKLGEGQIQPPPPLQVEEKKWGFDDAQIEAAASAAMPHPPMTPKRKPTMSHQPVPKPKRSGGLVFSLILILLLAGVAVGAWMWWQGRTAAPAAVVSRPVKHPVIQPPPVPAPVPMPVPPVTETTATTVAGSSPAVARPKPVAPAPAPVAPSPQPKPASSAARLDQGSGGSKVITNTPAAQTPPESNRGHYEEMARQYAKNGGGNFTVQFELVCQTSSLAKAVSAGGSNVWFVPTTYRGQSCYRVFWGHFDTRDAAVASLQHIPAGLRGSTPVVVPVPKS